MEMIILTICSLICWIALSLSDYLKHMESDNACIVCERKELCFAKSKIGSWNMVEQWMLITYFKIRKTCPIVKKYGFWKPFFCVISTVVLVLLLFWSRGAEEYFFLYGMTTIMLCFLSVVDWNTQYIPLECTILIFICGLIHMFADFSNWFEYVIGLFAVSGFLLLVDKLGSFFLLKKYEGEEIASVIGDGDIKLMAATGLLLGWKLNFLALAIGCISGSVIHLIRMKIKGSSSVLALGPYLSLGVYITMICGEQLISWYLNMWGVLPY